MTEGAVRVLIVDDQPPFRLAARAVVESVDGFVVVGDAETAEECLDLIDELTPDLVLMDLNLPEMDGAQAAGVLRDDPPECRCRAAVLVRRGRVRRPHRRLRGRRLRSQVGLRTGWARGRVGQDRVDSRPPEAPSGIDRTNRRATGGVRAHRGAAVECRHPIAGMLPGVRAGGEGAAGRGDLRDEVIRDDADPDVAGLRRRRHLDRELVGGRLGRTVEPILRIVADLQCRGRSLVELRGECGHQAAAFEQRREHPATDGPSSSSAASTSAMCRSSMAASASRGVAASRSSATRASPGTTRLAMSSASRSRASSSARTSRRRNPRDPLTAARSPALARRARLQQRTAERDAGLPADVVEQRPLEVPEVAPGRHGHHHAADLLAEVAHGDRDGIAGRSSPLVPLPGAPCHRTLRGAPTIATALAAPTARPVASATRAGSDSRVGRSASSRLRSASASYGTARRP